MTIWQGITLIGVTVATLINTLTLWLQVRTLGRFQDHIDKMVDQHVEYAGHIHEMAKGILFRYYEGPMH